MAFVGVMVFGVGYVLYNAVHNWAYGGDLAGRLQSDPAGQSLKGLVATIVKFFCYFLYLNGVILVIVGIFSCGKQ